MPLTPLDWNVIVIGRWNRAILTPAGIATRLFELPSGTEMDIEVPMDSIGPYRVGHDHLVVMVGNTQLRVEVTPNDFPSLQNAMRVAYRAMNSLPETPVTAAGFNIRCSGESSDARLASLVEATQLRWDQQFAAMGYHIVRRDVTWVVEWEGGKISVNLAREQADSRFRIAMNFERIGIRQDLMDWLARPVEQIKEQVRRVLLDVCALPIEVAEWTQ